MNSVEKLLLQLEHLTESVPAYLNREFIVNLSRLQLYVLLHSTLDVMFIKLSDFRLHQPTNKLNDKKFVAKLQKDWFPLKCIGIFDILLDYKFLSIESIAD